MRQSMPKEVKLAFRLSAQCFNIIRNDAEVNMFGDVSTAVPLLATVLQSADVTINSEASQLFWGEEEKSSERKKRRIWISIRFISIV